MKHGAPQFSIIIPVYNGEAYVARAIDSVLNQTWPAHEVIVIDDGSVDASTDVVHSYGDRVLLLRQANAGVAAARNAGASRATGDWLAFLDADDWYYPDRLKMHAEWIIQDKNLDFLTGDYQYVLPGGTIISGSMEKHVSGILLLARADHNNRAVLGMDGMQSFVTDHFGDTHTLTVPRCTFEKLGGYPTGYRVCEDIYFLIRLCAVSARIGVVCIPMAAYFIHDASATRRDPLRSQVDNVRTLTVMNLEATHFPEPLRRGVNRRLRNARLNLGYARIRAGQRLQAAAAVVPNIWQASLLDGLRDILSMMKG